jgi:hypothetical protein
VIIAQNQGRALGSVKRWVISSGGHSHSLDGRVNQSHNNRVTYFWLPSARLDPAKSCIVLINRESLPRNLAWIAVFAIGTIATVVTFCVCSAGTMRWPGGGSKCGMAFGILAAAIMVFEVLIWPRKKVRSWRLGSARAWMRGHIWLGLLTIPLVVLHTGFTVGGQLNILLMILFAVVIVSGLFGLALQQFLPRIMMERVPAETIYSQIEFVAEQSYWSAVDLVEAVCGEPVPVDKSKRPGKQEVEAAPAFVTVGALREVGSVVGRSLQTLAVATALIEGGVLIENFASTIGPYLLKGGKSKSTLCSSAASAAYFRRLRSALPAEATGVIDALEGLCEQRRQYDLQRQLHAWMHGWLVIHAPLSVVLVGLMFLHIIVALKYW